MKRLDIITLEGTPRERGRIHGESLRPRIVEAVARWREGIGAATGRDPDEHLRAFLAATDFTTAMRRWTPEVLEEIDGLADGAGLEPPVALAYQLIDEEWCFRRSPVVVQRCSSLGVCEPGSRPLIAQNLDLSSDLDGCQVLLHVRREDGREAFLTSYAGVLALNGLNDAGVGVCVNTLSQLQSSTRGLPVACVILGALRCDSMAAARAFVESVPHASGQNYVIGGADGVVDLECSAGRTVVWRDGERRVGHTNHPLLNDDLWQMPEGGTIAGLDGSMRRMEALERELIADERPVTVERAKELLSTPPLCRVPEGPARAISLFSVVMEVGADPVLHVAPGPASITAFERLTFSPP